MVLRDASGMIFESLDMNLVPSLLIVGLEKREGARGSSRAREGTTSLDFGLSTLLDGVVLMSCE